MINGLEIIKQLDRKLFFEKVIPIELLPQKKPLFSITFLERFSPGYLCPAQNFRCTDTQKMDYEIDTNMLENHLCQNCLSKVAASLEYRKTDGENKEAIPLCIVDFKTLEIYSLQDYWRAYFVRDYYVEMDFDDNIVRTEVFYLPERQ